VTLAEQLQDEAAQAHLYGQIGAVLAELDRLPEATAAAEEALALADAVRDPRLIGEQQILLAFLYHDLGEREQALAFCRQAVTTFETSSDDALAANAQALLVELSETVAA
jgi:tetratricopeptide (TPR) repeat protein